MNKIFNIFITILCLLAKNLHACELHLNYDTVLTKINNFINATLFFKILGVPFIVLVLSLGALFFTLRFKFINIRLFKHAFAILVGKYDEDHHEGDISHLQAFASALSSTVGLGTVAGVAIAISLGGPGAVPWMMIAGFFGMSLKFSEVTLAFKYRTKDYDQLFSGPFKYMRYGLEEIGFKKLGIVLASIYACLLILSGPLGSVAFQTNQMIAIILGNFDFIDNNIWLFSLIITALLGLVIIGGIERIAKVASSLVPAMSIIYIFSCIVIIIFNIDKLGDAFLLMFHGMIDAKSVGGGAVGAFVAGIRRAIFASEAGMGSAAITHAATKDEEPVRTGFVAMIEPCFDTMLICCLTGLIIVVTGAYQYAGDGILMTRKAFETVSWWFPILLTIAAPLFAFSSVIVFVYCCEMGWLYLFNAKSLIFYRIIVLVTAFFSGISKNIINIASIGDALFICSAIINMVALLFLSNKIGGEVKLYLSKLKNQTAK
ncbi:amino acid carrier protein [Candidatus Mesenet endosymbiont of Agriotes lineatus]|uniref:alanine/glycine:cation symporter family protein n=1 Tax=Candidatus Mesenet endosymbiont of Agriotes lineatus TaxID=3077948 RepID=UPI0030D1075D